jgi:hypothetical protein
MALQPVTTSTSTAGNLNQINNMVRQLNNEQKVKVFKGPSGSNAVINGKLPYEGGYGSLYYDTNGIPSIVIGVLPDGTTGLVISKPGVDVLSLFT